MTNPNQRFSVGLVPTLPPNPPLPDAAPAADAGEGVELTESDIDIIEAGARVAGHVSAEAGAALIADWRRMRAAERAAYDLMMAAERDFVAMKTAAVQAVNDCARECARAEAAEAERDRLADLPICRLQLPDGGVPTGTEDALSAWYRTAMDALIALRRERDQVEALRGAMPDPGDLDAAAFVLEGSAEVLTRTRHDLAAKLLRYSESIAATMGEVIHDDPAVARAALATATATPQAAGTGTGGDRHKDALNALCSLGVATGDDAAFRRAAAAGLAAWAVGRDARAAIDAALDQDADHAAQ